MMIIYEIEKCPKCGSKKIRFDFKHASIYCGKCGFVISECLPELRLDRFVDEVLVSKSKREVVIKFPHELMSAKERVGFDVLKEINLYCDAFNLGKNDARSILKLYERLYDQGFTKGRKRELILASLFHIWIRRQGLAFWDDEIARIFHVDERKMKKLSREIAEKLGMKLERLRASQFIARVCAELSLPAYVASMTEQILKIAKINDDEFVSLGVALRLAGELFGAKIPWDEISASVRREESRLKKAYRHFKSVHSVFGKI